MNTNNSTLYNKAYNEGFEEAYYNAYYEAQATTIATQLNIKLGKLNQEIVDKIMNCTPKQLDRLTIQIFSIDNEKNIDDILQ